MSRRHPDDSARDASWSLDELAREAGVTQRTIRYYIAEGLLPPPDSAGRNARYTREHLDRLQLIGQMKEAYLPLKEIRTRIASMSPGEIARAADPVRASMSRPPQVSRQSSAEDYVARALRESEAPYDAHRVRARVTAPVPAADVSPDRSWKRIPITDDAELLITDDAWDRRGEQIRSAIAWIRRMLNE